MNMNITQKLEGFYSLKVHGGKRGEIDFGTHKNMILDAGISNFFNGRDTTGLIFVGSGSSQPNVNQSQLDAKIAGTRNNKKTFYGYVSAEDSENGRPYGYTRISVQFSKGVAAGNIAELGVGGEENGSKLWSRSLVLDRSGNPTTITVLDDEFLTVTYEARRYVNTETVTTTLQYDDDGETKSVECRVVQSKDVGTSGWGTAGIEFGSLSDYRLTNPDSSSTSRKHSNRTITLDFKYSIHNGNNQDINEAVIRSRYGLIPSGTKLQFIPPLRKTNEFELTISVSVTLENA